MGQLKNLKISNISLVDEPANGVSTVIAKSKGAENVATKQTGNTETQSGMVETLANSVVEKMKNLFNIEKGVVQEKYDMYAKNSNIWNAWDAFTNSIRRYDNFSYEYTYETDGAKIRTAVSELSGILTSILEKSDAELVALAQKVDTEEEIAKAGKKMSTKNMTKLETIYELIGELVAENSNSTDADATDVEDEVEKKEDEKVENISKALEPIMKHVSELASAVAEMKNETTEQVVEKSSVTVDSEIAKALAPLTDTIAKLASDVAVMKSTRGQSAQVVEDVVVVEKSTTKSKGGFLASIMS